MGGIARRAHAGAVAAGSIRQAAGRLGGKELPVPAAEYMLNKVPMSQRENSPCAPGDDPTSIESISLAA